MVSIVALQHLNGANWAKMYFEKVLKLKIGSGLQWWLPLIYNSKGNKHLNHIVADGTVELNVSKQPEQV